MPFSNEEYIKIVDVVLNQKNYYAEYQPIIDSQTDEAVAYESLARFWYQDASISPGELFQAVHKDNDRLVRLENAVTGFQIRNAPADLPLFINYDIHAAGKNFENLTHCIEDNIKGNELFFELIEDTHRLNAESRKMLLDFLRHKGFKVALAGFGKWDGVFSFALVERSDVIKIHVDWLKLSKKSDDHFNFMKSFLGFAHSQDKISVLEGIESEEDRKLADELDVDYMQGFLFKEKFIIIDADS